MSEDYVDIPVNLKAANLTIDPDLRMTREQQVTLLMAYCERFKAAVAQAVAQEPRLLDAPPHELLRDIFEQLEAYFLRFHAGREAEREGKAE